MKNLFDKIRQNEKNVVYVNLNVGLSAGPLGHRGVRSSPPTLLPSSLSSFRPSLPCTLSTLSTLYFRSSILEFHGLIFLFPWPQEVVELTRVWGSQIMISDGGGLRLFAPGHTGSLARALLDPQDHPGASQEPPRATQDRIKSPQDRSKIPQERPKIP